LSRIAEFGSLLSETRPWDRHHGLLLLRRYWGTVVLALNDFLILQISDVLMPA